MTESIVKAVVFALVAVVIVLLLRQFDSNVALVVGVCASVIISVCVVDDLFVAVYDLYDIGLSAGIGSGVLSCMLKVVGIGYVAEFGNNICIDANCKSIGQALLFCAKICIVISAMPIVLQIFDLIKSFVV